MGIIAFIVFGLLAGMIANWVGRPRPPELGGETAAASGFAPPAIGNAGVMTSPLPPDPAPPGPEPIPSPDPSPAPQPPPGEPEPGPMS